MKPIDALGAVTRMGAELMGLGDKMGQIQGGYWADMILVDGNPVEDVKVLQDLSKIIMVMKGGKVVVRR
ncbi:MAG: amidohydrolase family protein [Bacillota bacterium]|jgi:imidazolonepropionase-like amidohydrolase